MTISNDYSGWNSGGTDISALLKKLLQQDQGAQFPQEQANPSEPAYASAIRGIPSALYSYQGLNLKPQQNIAAEMGNLANAQYDDSNPLFQKIYGQEKGAAQQNLAQAIAEASRQNNKLASMGRVPLFDAERGGETQFRALTQGYQTAQDTARARAREIIGAGQNAQAKNFDAQGNVAQNELRNKAGKASTFSTIASILPKLLKFM